IEGRAVHLAPLPVQYADYAIWQQKFLAGDLLADKLTYWKEKLDGVMPTGLSVDYERSGEQDFNGGMIRRVIGSRLRDDLQTLSREENVTLYMTLLSVFKVLIYRHTGQQDICIGTST